MHTPNGLTHRLLHAVSIRPAAPGLAITVGLLIAAVAGWTVTDATWFWPVCAGLVVLAVLLNTGRREGRLLLRSYQHTQRMNVANGLLNHHPAAVRNEDEVTGSIRELGGLVERFGQRLDDLLAEVHAEKQSASAKQHRR
jgi:hypothetical protein